MVNERLARIWARHVVECGGVVMCSPDDEGWIRESLGLVPGGLLVSVVPHAGIAPGRVTLVREEAL